MIEGDSSVSTVSGTMGEGDTLSNGPQLVRMRNYDYDTGCSANGLISEIGDSSTSSGNFHERRRRQQSNSDICNAPAIAEDMDLSGPRARSITGTNATENGDNSSMDSRRDNIGEYAFEERLVLSQRTATQGHEGSGFFLRLGCLREYANDIVFSWAVCIAYNNDYPHCSDWVWTHWYDVTRLQLIVAICYQWTVLSPQLPQ